MASAGPEGSADDISRGWDLAREGDFHGAEAFAFQALESDRDNPDAHNLMGFVAAAGGDPGRALESYRHAIRLDPFFLDPMLNAIEILLHPLNNTDAALHMAEHALQACQSKKEILEVSLLKIDALLQAGKKQLAKAAAQVLPSEPQPAGLEFLIGRARFETGDIDGALLHLERATVGQVEADAYYYLGLARAERKQFHEALVALLECNDRDAAAKIPAWSPSKQDFEGIVRQVLLSLPKSLSKPIDGALVVVRNLPPAELIAEGIDPRASLLVEFPDQKNAYLRPPCVFVYQRNVERHAGEPGNLVLEIEGCLRRELEGLK